VQRKFTVISVQLSFPSSSNNVYMYLAFFVDKCSIYLKLNSFLGGLFFCLFVCFFLCSFGVSLVLPLLQVLLSVILRGCGIVYLL
jgi:hypothetical protein